MLKLYLHLKTLQVRSNQQSELSFLTCFLKYRIHAFLRFPYLYYNIEGRAVEVRDATPMVWQKLHCRFDTAVQIWFKSYPLGVCMGRVNQRKEKYSIFYADKTQIKMLSKIGITNLFTTHGKFF